MGKGYVYAKDEKNLGYYYHGTRWDYNILVLICGVVLLVIRKHAKKQNGENEWAEEN